MQEPTFKRRVNILMVEDNAADAFLTREIFLDSEIVNYNVTTVSDADQAMSFLHGKNNYDNSPRPDLILLDLSLPRMHGFDFLAQIRENPKLKSIPVCILSTARTKEDVEKARNLRADCYLLKPLNLKAFEEALSGLV